MNKKATLSGLAVVIVMTVGTMAIDRFWGGGKFVPGVQYSFEHTLKSTVPVPGGGTVETRQFLVSQTVMFPALVRGPRGEQAIMKDPNLPINTFVWERKMSPLIRVGGMTAQDSYTYILVRYNQDVEEPQTLIPRLNSEPVKPATVKRP